MESGGGKKRSFFEMELDTDDIESTSSMVNSEDSKRYAKQNHSEIEKRRRDKLNTYITELATMIPMCNAMNRKLDKLTVLRMAVQYMKTVGGSTNPYTEVSHKPAFLSDDELKHLILKAAEGFLFVVGCDRGRLLYVSESVKNILCQKQSELIGTSLFDILHPEDISKVKEQLSSSDLAPRERLIDAKTMLPVKTEMPQLQSQLCSGARRVFFCRMKTANRAEASATKSDRDLESEHCHRKKKSDRRSYAVVHCTGHLKTWPPAKVGLDEDNDNDNEGCNLSCLVAIARVHSPFNQQTVVDNPSINVQPIEFTSRHALDGRFTYVDHEAAAILGYLPQELLGTSVYEYYHQDDVTHMAEAHKKVLKTKEKIETQTYRFRAKDTSYIHLKTKAFSFRNPWTKDIECIVTKNIVVPAQEVTSSGMSLDLCDAGMSTDGDSQAGSECYAVSSTSKKSLHIPGMKTLRPGVGRIGRQIADEVLENQGYFGENGKNPAHKSPSSTADLLPNGFEDMRMHINGTNVSQTPMPSTSNGLSLGSNSNKAFMTGENVMFGGMEDQDILQPNNTDGNDEAAMSVIMSLLEADAGLGGPVDFSGLPWPL